jgi:hypothetical protein
MKTSTILVIFAVVIAVLVTGLFLASGNVHSKDPTISPVGTRLHTQWSEPFTVPGVLGYSYLVKITIPEDNVTCYVTEGGLGGFSCIHDEVRNESYT